MEFLNEIWYVGRKLFLLDIENIRNDENFKKFNEKFFSKDNNEKLEEGIEYIFWFRFIYFTLILASLTFPIIFIIGNILRLLITYFEVGEAYSIAGLLFFTIAMILFGLGQYKSPETIIKEETVFPGHNFYEIRYQAWYIVFGHQSFW